MLFVSSLATSLGDQSTPPARPVSLVSFTTHQTTNLSEPTPLSRVPSSKLMPLLSVNGTKLTMEHLLRRRERFVITSFQLVHFEPFHLTKFPFYVQTFSLDHLSSDCHQHLPPFYHDHSKPINRRKSSLRLKSRPNPPTSSVSSPSDPKPLKSIPFSSPSSKFVYLFPLSFFQS